jgi:hypothetical protein
VISVPAGPATIRFANSRSASKRAVASIFRHGIVRKIGPWSEAYLSFVTSAKRLM